ncbi:MAG: hypothetical protein S4CHLAM102_04850 [Chlamydiia bacterium]|nr:hypothetical protein [Chlamydiia bacterium]
MGITSLLGPMSRISSKGERYTSSWVKPTTSAIKGLPGRLIMHISPMVTLGTTALISIPTTSVIRPWTVVRLISSSVSSKLS